MHYTDPVLKRIWAPVRIAATGLAVQSISIEMSDGQQWFVATPLLQKPRAGVQHDPAAYTSAVATDNPSHLGMVAEQVELALRTMADQIAYHRRLNDPYCEETEPEKRAAMLRQRDDLHAANNALLKRAREAEAALAEKKEQG